MSPGATRRSISEKAVIGIPTGIVALLLLSFVFLYLALYRRSRRSRTRLQKPIDLIGPEHEVQGPVSTNVSTGSSGISQTLSYNKDLPQTPQKAQSIFDVEENSSSFAEYLKRSRREERRVLSLTLPSTSGMESFANIYPHRVLSLNTSSCEPFRRVPSLDRGALRVLNLTEEDTFSMAQLSTPASVENRQTYEKKHHGGLGVGKRFSKLAVSPKTARLGVRNTFHAPFVKKDVSEHRVSTPPSLPSRIMINHDHIETSITHNTISTSLKHSIKNTVEPPAQPSRLAINIPANFAYHDSSQRSAFYDIKAPDTALPPYSSPGNGYPLRFSMLA